MESITQETIAYLNERSENIKQYSDKLSDTLREIDSMITPLISNAKLSFRDSVRLCCDDSNGYGIEEYFLVIRYDDQLGIAIKTVFEGEQSSGNYEWVHSSSRSLQVKAVKRLPDFLKAYGEYLKKKEAEYQEISEMAENMLKAIKKE